MGGYLQTQSASAGAIEFLEWVQVGIDVNMPYRKCQVK